MKKTNKFLAIILAILMVISIIPITASAATYSGTCGDNVNWTVDESTGTLTISGIGDMYDGEFSYPSWNADLIENVIISEGVTSIGEYAFVSNTNIKNVSIADSVTDIGEYAFYNCTGLTDVLIGKGVTEIDDYAFGYCSNLKTVTIYNAVERIGCDSFSNCSKLTDVYYFGTDAEWNAIEKGSIAYGIILRKTGLEKATIHFLDEETHECSYNAVVTAPTCTEQGYTTYTCECGDSYVDDYVNATGHSHTSEVTTPATHTETGIMTYTCPCGDSYTEVIAKLEKHDYESVVTAPTCTEQGYTTYTCECGDSYVDDYVDALGHTPANAVEENYIAPTCTDNGSADVVVYCSVCDEEISRETVTIEATGHADNDGDGYCDACNEQLEDNNSQISIISLIMRIINFILELFGIK